MLFVPSSLWVSVGLGLVIAAVVTQLANLCTTVYLHRTLSHKALRVSRPLALFFRTVLWCSTGIRPRQWAAVHRKHHACTDGEDDPHSPARLGWVRVQLTNVSLYRRVATDPVEVSKYARDLSPKRLDRVLFDHALIGLALGITLLVFLFGWRVALVASLVHFVGYIELSAAVNAMAHTFGKRPFANSATNLRWLALLTAGEGLHNNHHAAPTSARFSLCPHQWDPAWTFIKLCSLVGLVEVRHKVPVFVSAERR